MKRFFERASWLWITFYFSVLTIIMTYPLINRMKDSIVGLIGDNIYFIWLIGWTNQALFFQHVNPFDVWFLNYPQGWSLAYTEITPAQILLAQPFCSLAGPVFAYNATMMLTFVLSGIGMYLLTKQMTGNRWASLIAGTIFAFLPYHFAHFRIGHLNLSSTQWFPFYFMGLFGLLGLGHTDRNKGQKNNSDRSAFCKPVLLTGISLGLIALTSQYYIFMALIVSAFVVVYYLVFEDRSLIKSKDFWKKMVAAGLVALPLVLAGVFPYLQLAGEGGLPDRGISIVRPYSAGLTEFLLPSTDHFLWGAWIGEHFNRDLWIEGSLYIGAIAIILAVLAWMKRRELKQEKLLRVLLWSALFALVLAMGTDVHWNERPVTLPAPQFLAERLGRDEIPLVLPGTLLFYVFPLYAKLRAVMRFGIFVLVFSSLAAGIGAAWLLQRMDENKRKLLIPLILILIFVDFYPGTYQQFATISPRPVDYWLAQQPGEGAVVQMPFTKAEDQEQTFYTLTYQKPYVGGFFNAFPPEQYRRIKPVLDRFPDEESVDLLRELGVQYVLVDTDEYDDKMELKKTCEDSGLEFLVEKDDQYVFELSPH